MLGDTFVLAVNGIDNHPFRIAGTRLCALFGRELKAESFIRLWQRSGQTAIRELIAVVMEEKVGIVASVTGATSDDTLAPVSLEMLLLPLAYHRAARPACWARWRRWRRPTGSAPRRSGRSRSACSGTSARRPTRPAPRFKAAAGRLRHGLTVYDGGRAD